MAAAYLPAHTVPTMTNHGLEYAPEGEKKRCEEVGGGGRRLEDRPNGDGTLMKTEGINQMTESDTGLV